MSDLYAFLAPQEERPKGSTPQDSLVSAQRLQTALSEVEKYLVENYGTTPSAITYKEYTNGASLESKDPTFSTAVAALMNTRGMLNLPDNVLLYATSPPTKAMTVSSNTSATSSDS